MISHFLSLQLFKAFPLPSVLLKVDAPKFTIIAVNSALLAVSQKSSESELLGKGLFEVFPDNPNDANANGVNNLSTSLVKTITTGTIQEMPRQKYDIPVPNTTKFETRYWQAKNTPLFNESGLVEYIIHTTEDITEKVLLEEKEKELEILIAQKNIILEHTESANEIGNWDLDIITGEFTWSPEFFKMCGYEPNAFIPTLEKAIQIIHPEDLEKVRTVYLDSIENGSPYRIEHRIIRADGYVILVLAVGVAIKNAENKPIKLTGLFQNITSSKQLETMLRQNVSDLMVSESRYKSLFENNPSPMYIWDFKTLKIVDCNEEALMLYGYTREEFLTLTLKEIRPVEDIHLIEELTRSEEAYGRIHKRVWRHKKKNGDIIYLHIVGHLFDYNGRRVSLVSLSDVTDKIKAEEALKESETRYKSFFNNSLDANLLSIENGKILAANPVACKMFGYTEEAFCKLTRQEIADPSDGRFQQLLKDKIKTGHGESIHRLIKKDGSTFEAFVSSTEYKDINGEIRNAVIIKDLDEKIKAEKALKDSEAKYRSLFENALDASILASPNGQIFAVNPAACKMFEKTQTEMLASTVDTILDKTDSRYEKLLAAFMLTNKMHGQLRCKKKNERFFEGEISATVYLDRDNNKVSSIIIKDITEKIRAEIAIKETAKKYQSIFENSMDAVLLTLPSGEILAANPAACELFGMTELELNTCGRKGIVDYKDPELPKLIHERSLKGHWKGKITHIKKDGTRFIAETSSVMFLDAHNVSKCIVTIKDITDKIKAEKALKDSEAKYRSLFENAMDAFILASPDGHIIAANPAACNMFQYTETEMCDVGRSEIIDTSDPRFEILLAERAANGSAQIRLKCKRKNGEIFESETTSTIYKDTDGKQRNIVTIRDITEKIKAEQALKESESRYKSFFENGINAHFISKANGDIIVANQMASNMFGYSVAELCQMNRAQMADMTDPRILKLIRDKEVNGNAAGIHSMIHKNGQAFDVFITSKIYHDANGEERHAITIKDLSEQQKAEAALAASEKKYRLLFYQSPMPKWIYEEGTFRILEVNEAAINHYGYSREEFLNFTILDIRPEDEIPKLLSVTNNVGRPNGLFKAGKFVHRKKNGRLITVEISSIPFEFEGKNCKLVIANDITDVEYALKELALSIERYHFVTKATSDAIWDWDVENNRAIWGDGFESIFGYQTDTIVSDISFIIDNIHPDDKQLVVDAFYKIVKGSATQWEEEYRFKMADGTYAYVINKAIVIRNNAGRTIRIVGGMRDITTRKKEVLRLKLLESVITNSNDGVIITEAEPAEEGGRKIVYVNEAFTKITGYSEDEVIGKTSGFLIGDKTDKNELNKIQNAMSYWQSYKTDIINYKKNGEPFWANLSISPVLDDNVWYTNWVAIQRDVTEQKYHVTEMIKAIIKTQEDERFEIGSELHDNVCQILATCKIAFKMLEKNIKASDKDWYDQGIDQINLVFKEIRNLSHRLAPTFFKDGSLEEALTSLVRTFNIEDNYNIVLQFDENFKNYATSREFQLNIYRILQEQLRNIFKYAEAKNITISGIATVNCLIMTIKDDGIGFNPKTIKSGIGLANMKRRAELFGGKLFIESDFGKGCTITVEIPLTEVH